LRSPFYRVDAIPAQSNLLAPTLEEALQLARGDLALAFCPTCGFISNTAFDPASQELSAKYEATQGCSGTFNAFAKSLATRWAKDYLGPGKTALEIGCGRGEFVTLLHQVSGGRCKIIGIDPVLERSSPLPGAEVRLIADRYSDRYADLNPEFIVCRHTLEHIPDAGEFVRMIRRAIDYRATAVAIEVPDTLRVLREGAFWDVYYEHCSYFTPGSLSRLFRAGLFNVLVVRLEYDGQYIILEARATDHRRSARYDLEDDLSAVTEAVAAFPAAAERQLSRWRRIIGEALSAGRRLAVWGSGSKAVGFLSTLGVHHERMPHVVDINPRKQNTFLPGTGQQIVAPATLADHPPDAVIVMNPVYVGEIRAELDRLGLRPELYPLG
jgi:hypothetical protein